jgi:hypothetical protein
MIGTIAEGGEIGKEFREGTFLLAERRGRSVACDP